MSRKDPFHEGEAAARARRRRSLAIAMGLVAFMVIVFSTTMIRLAQNTAARQEGDVNAPAVRG